MFAQYSLLSLLISVAFCSDNTVLLRDRTGDVTDTQEGFPGHVALRPDYTFLNVVKMLRRMFDSDSHQRVQREVPFPIRDLRSRRMLLNFSNAY